MLQQAKLEHDQKQETIARRKQEITLSVMEQGGPCPDDVDALVNIFFLLKDKEAALHLQLNYHKIVLC